MAIVLHTMAGTLAGSDSWFNSPNNTTKSSAHYGVGLRADQPISQYVSLEHSAHANGIQEASAIWPSVFGSDWANDETISVETEDTDAAHPSHNAPVSDVQYARVLALCQRVILPAAPTITHLATHRSISPGSRCHCPGNRWLGPGGTGGRFYELAAALRLKPLVGTC